MNPSTAMSTNVRREPLALITCLETWKQVEINLKPRMTCTARSWSSRCRKISDLKTWFNKLKFTKLRLLVVAFLSENKK